MVVSILIDASKLLLHEITVRSWHALTKPILLPEGRIELDNPVALVPLRQRHEHILRNDHEAVIPNVMLCPPLLMSIHDERLVVDSLWNLASIF